MAGWDEGVENLQKFCAALEETNARLSQDTSNVGILTENAHRLEEGAHEGWAGLDETLGSFLTELENGVTEADTQLAELSELSHEAATARLGAAEDDVEEALTATDGKLDHGREDLERGFAELAGAGFDALGDTLEGVVSQLTQGAEADHQAFEAFSDAIEDLLQQTEALRSETVQGIEDAEGDLRGEIAALESDCAECVTGWCEEVPGDLHEECEPIGDELQQAYEGFADGAEADGNDVEEMVSTLAGDAEQFVAQEVGDLGHAIDETAERAAAFAGELSQAVVILGDGHQTTEALAPMVDDLEIAKRIVGKIDELLEVVE